MYAECIGADIVQYNEFSMNEKRKKNEKICFTLYAVSDLPLLCLSSSRQVDGMHDDDDDDGDDDDGGEKENRTRPVYICMFKKQLEIIPFLFSSQTDRKKGGKSIENRTIYESKGANERERERDMSFTMRE